MVVRKIAKKEKYKRYISVEESIIGSLLEIREMQAGRMPEKTWREFFKELDAETKEIEREEKKERIKARKKFKE